MKAEYGTPPKSVYFILWYEPTQTIISSSTFDAFTLLPSLLPLRTTMNDEQGIEPSVHIEPVLCAQGCGFFAWVPDSRMRREVLFADQGSSYRRRNVATGDLCSKCFREKQRNEAQAAAAVHAATRPSPPAVSQQQQPADEGVALPEQTPSASTSSLDVTAAAPPPPPAASGSGPCR